MAGFYASFRFFLTDAAFLYADCKFAAIARRAPSQHYAPGCVPRQQICVFARTAKTFNICIWIRCPHMLSARVTVELDSHLRRTIATAELHYLANPRKYAIAELQIAAIYWPVAPQLPSRMRSSYNGKPPKHIWRRRRANTILRLNQEIPKSVWAR